jgi:hypothetical protein
MGSMQRNAGKQRVMIVPGRSMNNTTVYGKQHREPNKEPNKDLYREYTNSLDYTALATSSTSYSTGSTGITWAGTTSTTTENDALDALRYGTSADTISAGALAEEMRKYKLLEQQPQDLMSCIYLLSQVFQRLTERRIELDNSDLRTAEPFEFRLQMNNIDGLFMYVAQLMDNMKVETRPGWLLDRLVEKGLI